MNSLCGPHKILCSGLDLAHGPWVWYRWFMLLYAFALHISLHVPHISGLPLAPPPPFLTVSPPTGHTFGTAPTPGGREKNFRSRKRGTWWAHIKQDCVLTGQPFSKSTVGPVKCFHILQINNYFFLITVAYCFIAALICQGGLDLMQYQYSWHHVNCATSWTAYSQATSCLCWPPSQVVCSVSTPFSFYVDTWQREGDFPLCVWTSSLGCSVVFALRPVVSLRDTCIDADVHALTLTYCDNHQMIFTSFLSLFSCFLVSGTCWFWAKVT